MRGRMRRRKEVLEAGVLVALAAAGVAYGVHRATAQPGVVRVCCNFS